MSILKNISRRSFLVSAGACLALPKLESFAASTAKDNNKKMIFIGQGYGFTEKSFYPEKAGRFSQIGLTDGLSPLEKHKNDFSLVGNLLNIGAGNPHCGSLTFLTGAAYTNPRNVKNSISCDQIAAEYLGKTSRYSSLVLSTNETKGGHGPALSMSWDKGGNPIAGINSSLALYKKLFASSEDKSTLLNRIKKRKSILDSMRINASGVSTKIAKTDKEKLDEYFQSLRQVELGFKRQVDWVNVAKPKAPFDLPEEIDGEKEIKLMYDMIALAIQTDQTRVISYMLPEQSLLNSMDITMPVHSISHYNLSTERTEKSMQRDRKCTELFGYLLDQLKEKKDEQGQRLFDSCLIAYGTNICAGHKIVDFPLFLSGGALNLRLGESLMLSKKNTPLANVWLTLLQEAGVPIEKFSHSTGTEKDLLA